MTYAGIDSLMVDESSFVELKSTGHVDGVFSASKQSPTKIDALAGTIINNLQIASNKAQGVTDLSKQVTKEIDSAVDTQLDLEPSPYQTVRSYMYVFILTIPSLRWHALT
jgi:hypothetical protein